MLLCQSMPSMVSLRSPSWDALAVSGRFLLFFVSMSKHKDLSHKIELRKYLIGILEKFNMQTRKKGHKRNKGNFSELKRILLRSKCSTQCQARILKKKGKKETDRYIKIRSLEYVLLAI